MVEGYPRWQVLWRIVLPLLRPGIVATAVLCFIFAWNEFLFAFMLGGKTVKTLPVGDPDPDSDSKGSSGARWRSSGSWRWCRS